MPEIFFGSADAPTMTDTTDTSDYELGMRFTANVAGNITQLRYYRGAADANDTDTRVLNLWDAAGTRLGSVTVTSSAGESGWQVGTLSTPIAIGAGATHVVSYGTTQNYAFTASYFTTAHVGPGSVLTAGPVTDTPALAGSLEEEAPQRYLEQVQRARHYIYEGDIFQANLSRRWSARLAAEATATGLYARLRRANPLQLHHVFKRERMFTVTAGRRQCRRLRECGRGDEQHESERCFHKQEELDRIKHE